MSTEPFKLDLIALVDQGVRHDVSISLDDEDPVHIGCKSTLDELARQLRDHGAPDAPFEQQVREMLATYTAMRQAGKEMPSVEEVGRAWRVAIDHKASWGEQERGCAPAVLALFASHFARLTQERDEARGMATRSIDIANKRFDEVDALRQRAERAEADLAAVQNDRAKYKRALSDTQRALVDARARIAELEARPEPSADVVEKLREAYRTGFNECDSDDHNVCTRAGIRAILTALAEMGEEAWPTPDDGREALRQRDGFYMEGARGVSATVIGLCRSRLSPVLGALRTRVAELEAKLSRVSKAVSPLLAYDGHGEGSECPHRYCGGGACPSGDADECEQPDAAPCEPDTCFAKAVDVARAVLQGAPS